MNQLNQFHQPAGPADLTCSVIRSVTGIQNQTPEDIVTNPNLISLKQPATRGLTRMPFGNLLVDRRCLLAILTTSTTASLSGCKTFFNSPTSQLDSATIPVSGPRGKKAAELITDICTVYGINYSKAEGIGLAYGLQESGSDPKPGGQRDYLLRELRGQQLETNIEALLAGEDTELVLLKGLIPPGAKKGDKFDVEVGTMRTTEATSLEYGTVAKSSLRPMERAGRSIEQGHAIATTTGRILIDALFETRQDSSNQLHGYILGGGTVQKDRDFGLKLNPKQTSTPLSIAVARAINSRFSYSNRAGRHGVAEPKSDQFITLVMPNEYRFNFGRYLQVVVNIAHSETTTLRLQRMEILESLLMEPETSELAAIQLEAIGKDGIPILKRAMRHNDLEVKFYAAQALAYQGEPDGIEHLRFVAEKEPAFRWHALTALSSLKGSEATESLKYLMHVNSAETRYGAFQALLNHSPDDPLITADFLGDFHFIQIPSETPAPMIHFARRKRNEIVLFGHQQTVSNDFAHVGSNVTIRSIEGGRVSIIRHTIDGDQKLVITNRVSDLIEGMYRAGLGYGDQLKIFRQAKLDGTLNSRLVVNALPRLGRTYVPGQFSAEPEYSEITPYVDDSNVNLTSTKGSATKRKKSLNSLDDHAESQLTNLPLSGDSNQSGQPAESSWERLRNWFAGNR